MKWRWECRAERDGERCPEVSNYRCDSARSALRHAITMHTYRCWYAKPTLDEARGAGDRDAVMKELVDLRQRGADCAINGRAL